MNQLEGIVEAIVTGEDVSIIEIRLANTLLSAITLDTAPSLKTGDPAVVGFKEIALSVGKGLSGTLSIRNQLDMVVKSLTFGKALTKIKLDFDGLELVSVITTASANRMELATGDRVKGFVKTTDMILISTK